MKLSDYEYHREPSGVIYCGDCLEILPLLDKVDLVLTDPPYNIHAGKTGNKNGLFKSVNSLELTGGFTDSGVDYDFLNNYDNWFCFCSIKQLNELLNIAVKKERYNLITWCKSNCLPTCNNKYLPDVEYIIHGFKKNHLFGDYKDKSCYFQYRSGDKKTDHPNEKPIPLIMKLINLGVELNQTILDPFLGSGTTAVASKRLGRKFIGIEISEKYCQIAVDRLRQEELF